MNRVPKSFSLFLIIWAGQLLSRIGSGIGAFTLGIYLFQQIGSTSTYSFLLLCAFLPSVLLAPIGGVIADRKDRKLMMVVGDLGSSSGILFIIIMFLLYPDKQWPIYFGIAISSMFIAVHSPAFKASVSDIVEEKAYSRASGLIQLAEASRYVVSPFIAGFLLTRFSLPLVLVLDLATFLIGAMTVILIKNVTIQHYQKGEKESFWADFIDAFRYIVRNRILFHLLYLTTIVTFITGILQVLFVPLVLSLTDAATLGTIQSISASGMLIGSIFIGMMSRSDSQGKVLPLSLGVAGLFFILIGTGTNHFLFAMAAFCFFLTLPFVNTSLEVLFRRNIVNKMQGRIWSLISLISQIGMLLALSITGLLADQLFNPLLTDDGLLAETVGSIIGTGVARGSGLMVILSGFFLVLCSFFIAKRGEYMNFKTDLPSITPNGRQLKSI